MNASVPYLGYRISLLSNSDIRYEGILSGIDSNEATVTLRNVRSMGTEGRTPHREILPSPEIYDCIVFRGQNIKDLTVCGNDSLTDIYQDPAIISAQPIGNGIGDDRLDENIQNFYSYGKNDDCKNTMATHPGSWGNVYHQPIYTAKDLIDNTINLKNNYTDVSNEDCGNKEQIGGKLDKKESQPISDKKSNLNKSSNGRNNNSSSDMKRINSQQTSNNANKNNKGQFKDEFDFEQSNANFKKEQRVVKPIYQRSNFFDNISSDIQEVVKERGNQRKLDLDTFGESAQNYRPRRYNNQKKFKRNYQSNNHHHVNVSGNMCKKTDGT
ncbi:Scd6-like Sm domain [Babesia microti strain RI]|uniref:Scd6-like Sm domain n=1 Tax=Babesia microti (strain RI) TaxID=1133968 RepID=A0A1N6LWE4_BABMR|nr:Scd6-like Sm domain [Babesia microti strain RI]SIO73192.1 Scd6-like Sm domain [Babesia microti strain RI]|eukprot:XP_021337300.1 Scd6-like Sm domain [Babesia microti strain RI]